MRFRPQHRADTNGQPSERNLARNASWQIRASQLASPRFVVSLGLLFNLMLLVLYYYPEPKALRGDEAYYLSLAQSFAAGQPAEHHPFWPPLYAESIGWLVRIFGPHRLPIQIVQIGLWLLAGGMYAWIGATVFQSYCVGIVTLALFVLSPELMAFSHFLWPEILHLFLFGLILATFIRWPQHWLGFVSSGVWLGLAVLTKSLLLPFVPVLGIFLYWQLEGAWSRRALRLGLLFVMCALVLLPTMADNAHRHDSWMVADSSVFNLWVGLTDAEHVDYVNDVARREFQQFAAAGATFAERQRVYREKLFDFVQDTGIVSILGEQFTKQYVRLLCAETQFTGQLPGSLLPAYTFSAVPLAALVRGYAYLMHAVVLGLGVFGICLLRWRPFAWPQLFLVFIVYNLGLLFFIHVKTRYVLQFLPMLMMFAGLAVQAVLQRGQEGGRTTDSFYVWSPLRLGVGGVAVIVIESVAFLPLVL